MLSLGLGLCHCRTAELPGQVDGGQTIKWQSGFEAEMMTARRDSTAAELVVEVDVAAVQTVDSARGLTAARRRLRYDTIRYDTIR